MSRTPTEAGFWARVLRSEDGCWLWQRMVIGQRYGRVRWGGRLQLAHRVSWQIANGPIPPGMHVLHHCDNDQCVRPDHLFLGTVGDNMRDAIAKGRFPLGERAGKAKLTENQVRELRVRYASGEGTIKLGREFGINNGTVSRIGRRLSWAHLA